MFFFSSRRRHTRCLSDWSSDVCSSDLSIRERLGLDRPLLVQYATYLGHLLRGDLGTSLRTHRPVAEEIAARLPATRSEERRVGKECRTRWWASHEREQ